MTAIRPKCGHSPGHEPGDCVPTLDSHAAAHLNDWLYLRYQYAIQPDESDVV